MSPGLDLAVTGLGAASAVGISAPGTCAALRAGIGRMSELATYAVDGELFDKEPVVGGRVPTEWYSGGPVEREWPGHERFGVAPPPPKEKLVVPGVERLLELAPPAAREAWSQAGLSERPLQRIGLYLGVDDHEDPQPVAKAVSRSIEATPHVFVARLWGRAAGLAAVDAAARDLAEGRVEGALVGGVDSLIRRPVLERLDAAESLRSAKQPLGVIPGEAGAFVFLESAGSAASRGARPLARLLAAGVADEPTAETGEPNEATGLTQVLHQVRSECGDFQERPLVVCDLNGDRYRATEWLIASLRTLAGLSGESRMWHPADCIGDPGAASGPLNLVWAVTALQRGYAPTERVLVWGASDGPTRAAAVLERAEPGRGAR